MVYPLARTVEGQEELLTQPFGWEETRFVQPKVLVCIGHCADFPMPVSSWRTMAVGAPRAPPSIGFPRKLFSFMAEISLQLDTVFNTGVSPERMAGY